MSSEKYQWWAVGDTPDACIPLGDNAADYGTITTDKHGNVMLGCSRVVWCATDTEACKL